MDGALNPYAGHVWGDGRLSVEARARLARSSPASEELPLPDLSDASTAGRAAVARWRRLQHESWGEGTEGEEIAHQPVTIAGVPCLSACGPLAPAEGPTILYLHGGGFVLGSAGVAAPITARLARRARVVSVDYRLAPEHPFPAALDDARAVFAALATDGPVALAGDSAGGGLAVAVALRTSAPLPVALVLLCPFVDHTARPDAPLTKAYRGAHPAAHPLVSPLGADLRGLPPTLVQTGTADALFGQAVAFARRARAAGADVTLDVWQDMWHTWQYHRELPEADQALAEAAAFVAAVG